MGGRDQHLAGARTGRHAASLAASVTIYDRADDTTAQNAGWWAGLPGHVKEQIITTHPESIANRGGIDVPARDGSSSDRIA